MSPAEKELIALRHSVKYALRRVDGRKK